MDIKNGGVQSSQFNELLCVVGIWRKKVIAFGGIKRYIDSSSCSTVVGQIADDGAMVNKQYP